MEHGDEASDGSCVLLLPTGSTAALESLITYVEVNVLFLSRIGWTETHLSHILESQLMISLLSVGFHQVTWRRVMLRRRKAHNVVRSSSGIQQGWFDSENRSPRCCCRTSEVFKPRDKRCISCGTVAERSATRPDVECCR